MSPKKVNGFFLALAAALLLLGAVFLPGTQPGQGRVLEDPGNCGCHRGIDNLTEPMYNWEGSMMAMAARDPIFFAGLDLANHDFPDAGTFCLRCHSPNGHRNGRTTPPDGSALTGTDLDGVFCDFCHAMVDPLSAEGKSLVEPDVTSYGNAMWVITNGQEKRGPYDNAEARHVWQYSPLHRSSEVCASCHDVSNPLLCDPLDPYNVQKCFTEQRTYSEWKNSWYATQGEAGNCQSCHMPHVADGKACKQGPTRTFLPVHHQNGGNTFVPDAIAFLFAGDNTINFAALADGKLRAISLLQNSATLEAFDATDEGIGRVDVRITNHTGHKLPTGYPEGRRMWINLVGYNALDQPVFESGAYNFTTAVLNQDPQAKIYEAHFGVEQPDGSCLPSFRLVQNNCLEKDNRVPPKGFTNAAFEAVGAGHAHYHYPDGQFWDDTPYALPASVARVDVNLYYQTTTKEYIEFLATAPGAGARGAAILNAFNNTTKGAPVLMESVSISIDADHDGMGDAWELTYGLDPGNPADAASDLDGDGLNNLDEFLNQTLPNNPDTDADGLNDGPEVHVYLTVPTDPDTDDDGLTDGDEVNVHFTDPKLWDTDTGGEPDGSEVAGGRDPLVPGDDGEMASYNPSWTAPECASGKSPCLVPATLIQGRDTIHNGPEPNQPNTILTSACADGNTGNFHDDESLDSFIITDLLGPQFQAGDPVRLDAKVWCWTDVGLDRLQVFYADSVSAPVWTLAGDTACPGIGPQDLSLHFNLPNSVGRQVIRAALTFESAAAPCAVGDWNDRDDVVLTVAPAASGDADSDGLPDAWENAHGCMQANTVDNTLDYDADGLDNDAEYANSTDPCAWDTDGDYLPDGYEVSNMSGHSVGEGLNPLSAADGALSFDTDAMPNAHEYWNGSDPWSDDPRPEPGFDVGCYFWGKGDGGPYVQPSDITKIQMAYVGAAMDYSLILPPAFDPLDLDRSSVPDPADISLAQYMYAEANRPGGYVSSPASLSLEYSPSSPIAVGDTTHLTVSVHAQGPGTQLYSPGMGVVFWVTSGNAALLGGEGTDPGEAAGNRYDVSMDAAAGALANIVVLVTGPGPVTVTAKVPACGVEPVGRWCGEVALPAVVVINP